MQNINEKMILMNVFLQNREISAKNSKPGFYPFEKDGLFKMIKTA